MTDSLSSLAIMQADIEQALQMKRQSAINNNDELLTKKTASNVTVKGSVDGVSIDSLNEEQLSRVIEMAWEDRTPFSAIEHSYGLDESAVIALMRHQLKPSSFRLWRARVTGRATKHQAKRPFTVGRAYCKTQYKPR